MNKFLFLIVFPFLLLAGQPTWAGNLGLGLILGSPTAFTGKLYRTNTVAYDFGIAFSLSDYLLVYSDYLIHVPNGVFKNPRLTPYYGIGAIVVSTRTSRSSNDKILGKDSGSIGAGVRVPFGVDWRPATPPLAFFAELVPGLAVIPETGVIVEGGIGLRYYF
jgi:hypothetical protein